MDIFKTILTSWPLAIVIIVFAIRGSLKKIIENRLFSFKVGNVEVTFDRLLEEVDESLKDENQNSEVNEDSTIEIKSNDDEEPVKIKTPDEKLAEKKKARKLEEVEKKRIDHLIMEDPEKAMKRSWALVYRELKRLGDENGLNGRYVLFDDLMYILIENSVISKSSYSAIIRLYQIIVLINASKNGYKWTEEEAYSFYKSCKSVLRQLKKID